MAPQQRYSWTEPALCHYDYDLTQAWFVYFSYTDQVAKKTIRKQVREGINYHRSAKERVKLANAVIFRWKNLLANGWNPFTVNDVKKMPTHYTVVEAFDRILALKLPTLKKRAKETYTHVHKVFVAWIKKHELGNVLMAEFSESMAAEYMDSLISEKHYAGRTHNDHLIILKVFINAMMHRKWIAANAFKGVKKQPTTVGRNLAYSDEERERVKDFLYEHDREMYYFSQIMYYTFIRRSELAGLRVGDFDLINKTITIPAHVSKNKAQESVVIPVGLEAVLKEMKLAQYPSDDFVFGSMLMRSPHQFKNVNHISTRHNKYLPDLKISNEKGLYSHKHTGVCVAYYATNKDVYAVMRQLRHRSIETTQIYLKSLGLIQNDAFRTAMIA